MTVDGEVEDEPYSWWKTNGPLLIFIATCAIAVGAYQWRLSEVEVRMQEGAKDRAQLRATMAEIRSNQAVTQEALTTIKAEQTEMKHDLKDVLRALDGAVSKHRYNESN